MHAQNRLSFLLVASITLLGCGGSDGSLSSTRAVLLDPEDESMPRGGATCSVVARQEQASATLAPPSLARRGDGFATVRVVREGPHERLLRVQAYSRRLEPLGTPVDIDPDGELPLRPRLAECSGQLLLAWQLQRPGGDAVYLAAVTSGEPPTLVAEQSERPALDCDGSRGAIVWAANVRGVRDILFRQISGGGELGPQRRISGATTSATHPSIACDSGQCAVAWSDRRDNHVEIWAALVDLGDAPAHIVRISSHDQTLAGAGGAFAPTIAPSTAGDFLVAWHDSRSHDEMEVYGASLSQNGRAGLARRISRSASSSTNATAVSCGGELSMVAWRDLRDGPPAVVVAAVDRRGRRLSAVVRVSGPADETSVPTLSCLDADTFAVGWTSSDDAAGGSVQVALVDCRR